MFSYFSLFLCLFSFGVVFVTIKAQESEGRCKTYGICDTFEDNYCVPFNCVSNMLPQNVTDDYLQKLQCHCPHFIDNYGGELCCNHQQIMDIVRIMDIIDKELKEANFSCLFSLKHLICEINCSPRQFEFLNITESKTLGSKGTMAASAMDVFISEEYEKQTLSACDGFNKNGALCNSWSSTTYEPESCTESQEEDVELGVGCNSDNVFKYLENVVFNPVSVKLIPIERGTDNVINMGNFLPIYQNFTLLESRTPETNCTLFGVPPSIDTPAPQSEEEMLGNTNCSQSEICSQICEWASNLTVSEVMNDVESDVFYHARRIQLSDLPTDEYSTQYYHNCEEYCPKSAKYENKSCKFTRLNATDDNKRHRHCQLWDNENNSPWNPDEGCSAFCAGLLSPKFFNYECHECTNCTAACVVTSVDVYSGAHFHFKSTEKF